MKCLAFLLRHSYLILMLHLSITLAMLPGVLSLGYDNSPENFFAEDAEALSVYKDFTEKFGSKKTMRAAIMGNGLWTAKGLTWLAELEEKTAKLQEVDMVIGMVAFHRWFMLQWPPPDPVSFRSTVINNRMDLLKGWVSRQGELVTMLIVLPEISSQSEGKLLKQLYSFAGTTPPGIEIRYSGLPVLHHEMDKSLARQALRVIPFLILLSLMILVLIFRRFSDIVVPLSYVVTTLFILFGIMGYMGTRFNLVTFVTIPLLFVISLATAIHILIHFRRQKRFSKSLIKSQEIIHTYRDKGWPVVWTGLTTLVAFGSLITSNTPPLRAVGVWTGLGIIIMTVLAFTFYPVLLAVAYRGRNELPVRPFERWARKLGGRLSRVSLGQRNRVIALIVITLFVAGVGMLRLEIRDNIVRYFPAHHSFRMESERLQAAGVGVFSAELYLYDRGQPGAGEDQEGFQDPDSQQKLAQLSKTLRSYPQVIGAIGSGDLLEASIRSLKIKGKISKNTRWMALGILQSIENSRKLLHSLITKDGKNARITILVPLLSYNRIEPLFKQVIADAKSVFPTAKVQITGQYPLLIMAQKTLFKGLLSGISITLLGIMIIFAIILKSLRMTFIIITPNLWPVVLVLGGMGLFKVPLDSVSVMTVSIVLGLAVDDTFHTLGHYLKQIKIDNRDNAIIKTMEQIAPAHILTSITLVTGFLVCAVNDLLPIARMGILSAIAITLALIGDLLIVPALLGKGKRQD
jgi:uncharacterized protein